MGTPAHEGERAGIGLGAATYGTGCTQEQEEGVGQMGRERIGLGQGARSGSPWEEKGMVFSTILIFAVVLSPLTFKTVYVLSNKRALLR